MKAREVHDPLSVAVLRDDVRKAVVDQEGVQSAGLKRVDQRGEVFVLALDGSAHADQLRGKAGGIATVQCAGLVDAVDQVCKSAASACWGQSDTRPPDRLLIHLAAQSFDL